MKKTFMIMAAMLLMSVSAFAQSSETPLKGDVNEDGVVDVADINAVIAIIKNNATPQTTYYWYVGLTQPTEDNYQSIATEVTSYNDHYEFTNTSSAKAYIYVLAAADISVQMQDQTGLGRLTIEEVTSVNISGHKVYKTGVRTAIGGTIFVDLGDEWKHYYLGTTQPTEDNIETLTPSYKSFAEMNNTTIHVPAGGKLYLLAPYSYSEPESMNRLKNNAFIDSDGNHVSFANWSGYYKARHTWMELTVDNETTVTFKYPFE